MSFLTIILFVALWASVAAIVVDYNREQVLLRVQRAYAYRGKHRLEVNHKPILALTP